jgi:hypothetical protein
MSDIIPDPPAAYLEQCDRNHAEARAKIVRALEEGRDSPEEKIIRWVISSGTNPWSVFVDPYLAGGMGSLEGAAGVLLTLAHAFHDDGDISFVRTSGSAPMIFMYDHREPDFEKRFLARIAEHGHGAEVMENFQPAGIIHGVDAFIAEHVEHERQWREAYEEFGPE